MATPNTSISSLSISDVNAELNFPGATGRKFNDAIFRSLTGVQNKTIANTSILISDVSDKSAMDGILSVNSNTASSYGLANSAIALSIDSDMVNPLVQWSYGIISGGGNITLQPDGAKGAILSLFSNTVGSQSANVQVFANVSFQGQFLGSDSKYVNLSTVVFNPNLQVTGTLTVNNSGSVAQTATTQITASSNVVGGSIQFITSPLNGGSINGNTITFSSFANQPGVDNNNIYTLTTSVFSNGIVVASNTVIVNTRAQFIAPGLDISTPASTNNVFANTGPITSSLRTTATHAIAGANVVWTATKVSGDDATLLVVANNAYANITLDVAVFGAKKSVYDLTATLQYSNGFVLNQKTQRLTLRTVGYGLTFVPAPDATSQGYSPQIASSTATAIYRAGTLTWDTSRTSGTPANIAPSISSNTASLTMTVSSNTVGAITSVNRVNPVISFDGIVVANVSSLTTVSTDFQSFTFSVTGGSSNTLVGNAPLTPSVLSVATFDIPGGYVVWSKNNGSVSISSNTTAANLHLTTSTIDNQTTTLNAKLYDQFNRLVAENVRVVTLRAYVPSISFSGANTAVASGYSAPQVASVDIQASARSGADSFAVSISKLSGDSLTSTEFTGNTTFDRVTLVANNNAVGTISGQYRLTATASYFGVTFSQTFDTSLTSSVIASTLNLTPTSNTFASYNSPSQAIVSVAASYSLPGGYIQWGYTLTGLEPVSANNSLIVFRGRRDAIGTSVETVQAFASLYDSGGTFVTSSSANATATSIVSDPNLVISGSTSATTANVFQATASVTLTAAVDAAVVGETFQISTTKVSGSDAAIVIGSNSAALTLTANGVDSLQSIYDVVFNVVLNGQTIDTETRRITLNATALTPVINFASSDSIVGEFNYPVNAAGLVTASSTPACNVQFTVVKTSGSNLTTNVISNQVDLTASQSAVGAIDGTYQVTANYFTPGTGQFITSRVASVRVRAERYDPGFSWTYTQGSIVNQLGWEADITAVSSVQASANASMTGAIFDISGVLVSGPGSYSETSNSATITLTHNRITHGVTSSRESVWDVTCAVIRGAQTIAGPFTRRVTVRTTPYFMTLTPSAPARFSTTGPAQASSVVSSNHEAFNSSTITWNTSYSSGNANNVSFTFDSTNNTRITGSLPMPFTNVMRTAVFNFTANFFANGANRTESGTMTLETLLETG